MGLSGDCGNCEIENSDDSMEMSQETMKSKGKRGDEFDGIDAKKLINLMNQVVGRRKGLRKQHHLRSCLGLGKAMDYHRRIQLN